MVFFFNALLILCFCNRLCNGGGKRHGGKNQIHFAKKGGGALTTAQGPPPTSKHACICFGEKRESNTLGP